MDTARKNSLGIITWLHAVLVGLVLALPTFAQDVTVVVNPVQHVLPPQSGRYLTDPGRYFTIQLFNQSDETQYSCWLHLCTPCKYTVILPVIR